MVRLRVWSGIRTPPENMTIPHGQIYNSTSPNIQGRRVEALLGGALDGAGLGEYLGPEIGDGSNPTGHVGVLVEHFTSTPIGDLQDACFGQEEVFGLDVTMDKPNGVKISNTKKELFEEAIGLGWFEAAGLKDNGMEITAATIWHHMAPFTRDEVDEIEGSEDVGMVDSVTEEEFGGGSFPELLLSFATTGLEDLEHVSF